MTTTNKRTSGGRKRKADGQFCPSCGAALPAEARFCSACGVPLAEGERESRWSIGNLAWWGTVAALVAVPVVLVIVYSTPDVAPQSPPMVRAPNFPASPGTSPGTPPDLSRMTPREAADRLFNRIMMADEKGQRDEAQRFVPMAVQAYGMLPTLDLDAHYHLGLIHLVAGDRDKVGEQIAALRQGAPDHLLALVLEHFAAERAGDRAAQSRALLAMAGAYKSEISKGRPEYEAHRNTIDKIYAAATTTLTTTPAR